MDHILVNAVINLFNQSVIDEKGLLPQGSHEMHGRNEAEIFIIAILGGK